ncbi:MAG TPA: GTPase HflX [Bryobacteraceae bacterium]|nr:GTPase HflX [Bryobacteraceae bacterium]
MAQSRHTTVTTQEGPERALLVGVDWRRREGSSFTAEESLEELETLARSAGAEVIDRQMQVREKADPAYLIGPGKVDELAGLVKGFEIDVVIFDHELSPTQLRNLERKFEVRVLDRTQLILDIFASRARTREGQLQVELAQLQYLLPRLSGHGASMSRQGGGIGTRGPGETKLETDRRRIRTRLAQLERSIEAVRGTRGTQRRQRQSVPLQTVALVGYTNAGKSTLFNRLTGADVTADSRMFATLDPTVRTLTLASKKKILLSDTVGFIRNLPTTLVKAFRATLEEVTEAALLLHVVDGASEAADGAMAHVQTVLEEIGAQGTPQLVVWNKADAAGFTAAPPGAAVVSAASGIGLDALLARIATELPGEGLVQMRLRIPAADGAAMHQVHEQTRILSKTAVDEFYEIEAEMTEGAARVLEPFLAAPSLAETKAR